MCEDVYVNTGPDLTKKVRYGRGEREMEMEERGEIEEGIDDIYLTPDDRDPIYDDVDSGTQQDDAQKNTAQEQHGGSGKQNRYIAAAVCVGLLCLLLLAGIIILVILYCLLIKEKHNLQSSFDQTRHDNMTKLKDQWNTRLDTLQTSLNNMTEQKDKLQTRLKNMTEQKDKLQTRHDNMTEQKDKLQTRHDNMTKQKEKLQTSFDELEIRYNNMTNEQDHLKRRLCESHGFTFGDGVRYYISTESKTWEESRAYCKAKQSDLMIINSKEKQDLVVRVVLRNQRVWMGLTDRETEGVWKWVDGTPLTTPTYWHHNEPNNNGGEDCVELYDGGWNDGLCSAIANRHWMCEIVI